MIQDAFISLGAWAWIILGVLLIGVELLAPARSSSGSGWRPS